MALSNFEIGLIVLAVGALLAYALLKVIYRMLIRPLLPASLREELDRSRQRRRRGKRDVVSFEDVYEMGPPSGLGTLNPTTGAPMLGLLDTEGTPFCDLLEEDRNMLEK